MSLAESARSVSPAAAVAARYRLAPIVLIVWLAVAAAAVFGGRSAFDSMSTDDFVRLAMVRDLLAGQGWFDLAQYRLNPPAGLVMHWSRIADLPVAGIVLALTPTAGRGAAELAAVAFWPALLLLPVLGLAAFIARRLAGDMAALAAVLLIAVSGPVLVHFRSGAIDHHGLQLLLLLAAIAGAMERERNWAIAGGGLAAALSLAVGLEMLPALAALLAAVGLRWAIEGEAAARAASLFGLAFSIGAALFFFATVPAAAWSATACDAFSAPWLAAALLSGGALALLAAATSRLRTPVARLFAGGIGGLSALALLVLAFPSCLGDPYASLDPRMTELWLGEVYEAQSILALMRVMPDKILPFHAAPVAALIAAAFALRRMPPEDRILFLPPLFALAALTAVSFWQLRGASAANLMAFIVLAAALVRLPGGGEVRSRVLIFAALAAISGPVMTFAGKAMASALAPSGPARTTVIHDGPETCRLPRDVAPLQGIAPGLVLSSVDLGPLILANTPHAVLAAPYHRNSAGNGMAFAMLTGNPAAARQAMAERNIRYVAICPGSPDHIRYARFAPDGLAARLAKGDIPDFLESVPASGKSPLRLFRVRN